MSETRDRFLRLKDLAAMLGVSVRTLFNWNRKGRIVLVCQSARVKGMPESAARAWMSGGQREGGCDGQRR